MSITGQFKHYKPESYLPRFAYFPLFFNPTLEGTLTTLDDVELEMDKNGIKSIIRLVDSNGDRISPFIDLTKYDAETKKWYMYHEDDNLPYRYTGNSGIYNMYPSDLGPQTHFVEDDVSFATSTNRVLLKGHSDENTGNEALTFYRYAPIFLIAESNVFTDLTDYTNITTNIGSLSQNPSSLEFFYDFEERLHTNQNLERFSPKSVKLLFSTISTNSVSLKCVLSSNSGKVVKETPVVDDYIFKLKGQYLRS